jgi:hypothetical protein
LILFFIRFWPPSNLTELTGGGGVSINFGDSDLGSGSNYESEVLEVQNIVKETPTINTPDEATIAHEYSIEESVVIPKKEKTAFRDFAQIKIVFSNKAPPHLKKITREKTIKSEGKRDQRALFLSKAFVSIKSKKAERMTKPSKPHHATTAVVEKLIFKKALKPKNKIKKQK